MKKYQEEKQHRYPGYDYAGGGFYFVTICVQRTRRGAFPWLDYFGRVRAGKMELSDIGRIADLCWQKIPEVYPMVKLDEYIIMPDHVHGVIEIIDDNNYIDGRNAPRRVPTGTPTISVINGIGPLKKNSLSSIINHYKGKVKKLCNQNGFAYFAWQSRFHDRIVRDREELGRIRQYIRNNPAKWQEK